MLQGREINLLFLSPAPGIEPGSAGVQLQCFAHRPRRPTFCEKKINKKKLRIDLI